MNIFEFWNESSEFPLFLMEKFALIYECFGLRAHFQNELCSQTKVKFLFTYDLFEIAETMTCPPDHHQLVHQAKITLLFVGGSGNLEGTRFGDP
jgi:hypothetical protein